MPSKPLNSNRRLFLRQGACAAALFVAFATGCSNDPPGQQPKPKGDAATPATGKLKIAGVGFQEDQFFKMAEQGMKTEAEKGGVEFVQGSSVGSVDKEISLIDAYIAQKVNAIAIAPVNPKASIAALQRAHDAGIKIVTFDSPIEADFPVSNIKSDQISLGAQTGKEAAEYIQQKMGGKAKIGVLTYLSLLPEAATQRNKGFEDEVKKLPGVQIVAKQDAWIASEAVNVAERMLTAHPDIDLIWGANEGGTVGAVTAVKNGGKAGKIVVFGTDISEQMADFLLAEDNILQAVTGQKPFDIGSMAVQYAVKALKGEKVEKKAELPGMLFSRRKPDEVKKQKEYLHGLAK